MLKSKILIDAFEKMIKKVHGSELDVDNELNKETQFHIRETEKLLYRLSYLGFEYPDELRILANIMADPFTNAFVSLDFAGINEVSDEEFLYGERTGKERNGLSEIRVTSSKIKDVAEFSKIGGCHTTHEEIKELIHLHGNDVLKCLIDMCIWEMLHQFYRMVSEKITDIAESKIIDLKDLSAKDALLKIERYIIRNNHDCTGYRSGSILASPDVCTLITCSDEFSPNKFSDDSHTAFPLIGKFKNLHVYRNMYSVNSELLHVSPNASFDSGLIVIPGIGYEGNALRAKLVSDESGYKIESCLPFAHTDKPCEVRNPYSHFKLENLKLF